jgi:hypothetical protein
MMIVISPSIIHPMAETSIEVHGPIDISDPKFFDDSKEGFSNVHLELKNNEDITRTVVVLLQFQDNQGYTTQIVQSELLSVWPDETFLSIVDFENEVDTRLLDVFVWTNLGNPQPIASFKYIKYIGESNVTFFKIPISGERSVLLSHILSGCEDVGRDCDYDARVQLYLAYQECAAYEEFGMSSENWICSEPGLVNYS